GLCFGGLFSAIGLVATGCTLATGGQSVVDGCGIGLWGFCRFCGASTACLHYGVSRLAVALAVSAFKCVDGLLDRLVCGAVVRTFGGFTGGFLVVFYCGGCAGFGFFWPLGALALVAGLRPYTMGCSHWLGAFFIGLEFAGEPNGTNGKYICRALAGVYCLTLYIVGLLAVAVAQFGRWGIWCGGLEFRQPV